MRPSAKNETKWNVESEESLKLLILFLYCSIDEIYTILLYWYAVHSVYILQHLPDSLKLGQANAFYKFHNVCWNRLLPSTSQK